MNKQKWIRVGILSAVFVTAVIGFSILTNQGQVSSTADMSNAVLPRVYFNEQDYDTNSLMAYKEKMDPGTMYDAVAPLNTGGHLFLKVDTDGDVVEQISYEVFSMDGSESLSKGEAELTNKNQADLDLNNAVATGTDAMAEITLNMRGAGKLYYYTRVTRVDNLNLKSCMDYVLDFHNQTFDKEENTLNSKLESDASGDNTTFQHVTINSSKEQVTWGKLDPIVNGDLQWSIKESNGIYNEIQLEYQVFCNGDGTEKELYNVKEFFRVRYDAYLKKVFLLGYDRTMNQVLDGSKNVIGDRGISLGIRSGDVDYMANNEGTVVSFVQERELWNYNEAADELSLVFSFSNSESNDIRNRYDQHKIRILSVDNNGSTTFVVYGYMNRGEHEGYVGAAIYYFDIEKNAVIEKAFIPSTKSFAVAEGELSKLLYYSESNKTLYVLAAGTFYKVDLENNEQSEIAASLNDGEYVTSDDGELLAYQTKDKDEKVTGVTVLNFRTGKSYDVTPDKGEVIRPLGFVNTDFLYGYEKDSQKGKDVTGTEITPMYKVEVRNAKKVKMTYEQKDIFVQSVTIDSNMVTMDRLTLKGEVYTSTTQDYITNNETVKTSSIYVETYTTDLKEKQIRLTYEEGIADNSPKLLQPKIVKNSSAVEVSYEDSEERDEQYYVYVNGEMKESFAKAYAAIGLADQEYGTVISEKQAKVWQRGNRDLEYTIGNVSAYQTALQGGTSGVDIIRNMATGNVIDLTGCGTEQTFYLINQATPVAAMTGDDQWILLIGYSKSNVTYLDPAGNQGTMSITDLDNAVAQYGKAFFGHY